MSFIADIFSANEQADATEAAAQKQADASKYAADLGNKQFEAIQQRDQPVYEARNASLAKLRQVLGIDGGSGLSAQTVMNEPGYKFGLDQGQQAINSQATARGMRNSGAQLKAAARFGTDYATTKYDNAFNRIVNPLQSMSGQAQTAIGANNQLGMQNAVNAGQNAIGAANAAAAADLSAARGWGTAANSVAGWFGQNNPFAQGNPLSVGQPIVYNDGNVSGSDQFGWKGAGGF